MKKKVLHLIIALIISINSYCQKTLWELGNPNCVVSQEKNELLNGVIPYAEEISPYSFTEILKGYGIDAKRMKIKTVKSKYSYLEFDSLGNLKYIGFKKLKKRGAWVGYLIFDYDKNSNLIKIQGSALMSPHPMVTTLYYDSLNRVVQSKIIGYNDWDFKLKTFDATILYHYNNLGRRMQEGITPDSIINFNDSIIRYRSYSHEELFSQVKISYIFKNNNIVEVRNNNIPFLKRTYDERNYVISEDTFVFNPLTKTNGKTTIEYNYYADGRIKNESTISYNEDGTLNRFGNKGEFKVEYTFFNK